MRVYRAPLSSSGSIYHTHQFSQAASTLDMDAEPGRWTSEARAEAIDAVLSIVGHAVNDGAGFGLQFEHDLRAAVAKLGGIS